MPSRDIYIGEDNLESTREHIEHSLHRGSTVISIAEGMGRGQKAVLIITKELELYIDDLSDREVVEHIVKYINDEYKHLIHKSCESDVVKEIMEKHFNHVDIDEFSDYLTLLLNNGAYQKINNCLTRIMASFEPYMKERHPEEFECMTEVDHAIALIKFVKEHLASCAEKND